MLTAAGAAARRRFLRPWGIGLIAADPDSFARGTRRMRLTHAAAVSSAMALAWTLPTASSPLSQRAETRPVPAAEATAKKKPEGEGRLQTPEAPPATAAATDEAATDGGASRGQIQEAPAVTPARLGAEEAAPWAPAVIAEMGGIQIFEPSPDLEVVGFHEATYGTALPMVPAFAPEANHGVQDVQHGDHEERGVGTSMVLPTRNRATHPASAIDLAIPEGSTVLAPVSGTVTAVDEYSLYGRHADYRIEITPAGHPEIMVIVLHVTDPLVEVGDEVEGGVTPFASSPTAFPFESQIDRFTEAEHGEALPHVHVEMRMR